MFQLALCFRGFLDGLCARAADFPLKETSRLSLFFNFECVNVLILISTENKDGATSNEAKKKSFFQSFKWSFPYFMDLK